MTDLERFVELYKSFGINCVVTRTENDEPDYAEYNGVSGVGGVICIKLSPYESDERRRFDSVTDDSPLVIGVSWAWNEVWFDKDGKFLGQLLLAS